MSHQDFMSLAGEDLTVLEGRPVDKQFIAVYGSNIASEAEHFLAEEVSRVSADASLDRDRNEPPGDSEGDD
jgi:hypothetical protein